MDKPKQPMLIPVARRPSKWRGPAEVEAVRFRRLKRELAEHEQLKEQIKVSENGIVWPKLGRM